MRLGIDGRKIPEAGHRGPVRSFDHAKQLGFSGLFFRTVLDMTPTLDLGLLRATRDRARELGMYLETGLGKVNPYALPETPEVRRVGDGDTILGFRRMMEACVEMGCFELWVATAGYKSEYHNKFSCDRFRTDVTWAEQLQATERFLKRIAPMARDLGIHLNLETHEEITSFEVVRLVEAVGPDVTGIVFDTGNVLQRMEHPVWSARRVAPYVRQTHVKDALIGHVPGGMEYQKRPCGAGVVDWAALLPVIAAANPTVNLTIENDDSYVDRPRDVLRFRLPIDEPDWLPAHPDLTPEEHEAFNELLAKGDAMIARGEVPDFDQWASVKPGYPETVDFVQVSAAHLREVCRAQGLPLEP